MESKDFKQTNKELLLLLTGDIFSSSFLSFLTSLKTLFHFCVRKFFSSNFLSLLCCFFVTFSYNVFSSSFLFISAHCLWQFPDCNWQFCLGFSLYPKVSSSFFSFYVFFSLSLSLSLFSLLKFCLTITTITNRHPVQWSVMNSLTVYS